MNKCLKMAAELSKICSWC